MVNINKLKGKIVEKGMNVETVSELIGMDKATFYRKMNAGGKSFTIGEVDLIADVLELTIDEVNSIFFAREVA